MTEVKTLEENDQELQVVMQLIMFGGNAKSSAFEALRAAKTGDFSQADAKLKEADGFLSQAHNAQTAMLTDEANGKHAHVSLLMVHGQDHIMNAITFRDLAGELIDLYRRLDQQK
ncbi:PTS lactose/cellobiose transporter subunit IIA [Oenococcus kitaharae]|uniref:PTS systemcellobiose-specific IIA component n=1 Tax=Oenococcus kitaharae DSM 17330 TaxID=1045004 RepID=G9WIJ4_9LACO|nr:PTS lactose/cellobiose transporter subunit IIA [Oenococcus kitaharae]EHN58133.1 PTS systemcellobiose-specific IIA component [Oenococcus kitaharae DSM 17330]OEY81659.1 PTS cellobiose transporter subunit IIA [Oenococcus kitaharae]OEY83144.1 PTS cellobiose transporter subunit IIA [Oenococcus kitaharae]OEY84310.1 PTS cellobiose transporter subunit IIA [Oenococcus kitaharae]